MTPTPQEIDERIKGYLTRAYNILSLPEKKKEFFDISLLTIADIEIAKLIQAEEHHEWIKQQKTIRWISNCDCEN